jgi:hypothetical protein
MNRYASETAINEGPLRSSAEHRSDSDELDRSGNAILFSVQEAAKLANADCERASTAARELSGQVRSAEDRVKELEAEARTWHDRAFAAEKWLLRIYKEIEGKFFNQPAEINVSDRRSNRRGNDEASRQGHPGQAAGL